MDPDVADKVTTTYKIPSFVSEYIKFDNLTGDLSIYKIGIMKL